MDPAVIRQTAGWWIAASTNQLYVGRAWSGSDSFTAPAILMGGMVLHCMAPRPFHFRRMENIGHYTSPGSISQLQVSLRQFPLVIFTLVSTVIVHLGGRTSIQHSNPVVRRYC